MAEALHLFELKKYKDAELLFQLYWNDTKKPICYSFLKLGIKISLENNNFQMGFEIIERFKSVFQSNPFLREELSILFYLKKYKDVVQLFRKNSKVFSQESDIRYFGLSLYFLGLYKESEEILSKSKMALKLPSFEEKRTEFLEIFEKSREMESRWSDLSFEQKQDVGFAYLFHSDYKKAEQIFTSLVVGK
jgi:tetratricopeptide (TPR) repeat protein